MDERGQAPEAGAEGGGVMTAKHMLQLHKITDGTKSWCGRSFPEHDANPDLVIDGPSPDLCMDYEGCTCGTCLRAFEAFCDKYPND